MMDGVFWTVKGALEALHEHLTAHERYIDDYLNDRNEQSIAELRQLIRVRLLIIKSILAPKKSCKPVQHNFLMTLLTPIDDHEVTEDYDSVELETVVQQVNSLKPLMEFTDAPKMFDKLLELLVQPFLAQVEPKLHRLVKAGREAFLSAASVGNKQLQSKQLLIYEADFIHLTKFILNMIKMGTVCVFGDADERIEARDWLVCIEEYEIGKYGHLSVKAGTRLQCLSVHDDNHVIALHGHLVGLIAMTFVCKIP